MLVAEGFYGPDYGIRRFHGQALWLPQRREWWPDAGNLAAQRGQHH